MAHERISIRSLLNDDEEQEPRPRSTTPLTIKSSDSSESMCYSRENTQSPRAMTHSPSPTLSQNSVSSDQQRRIARDVKGRGRVSGLSSGTPGRQSRRASNYTPYEQAQRSRKGDAVRQFRPGYDTEESYFIWYHRLDLELDWSQISTRFNDHFPQKRNGCQGFQCKFYRFLQENGLPSVRERKRDLSNQKRYNLRAWLPDVWYPWMAPDGS